MAEIAEKCSQVADQCKAVAHLAAALVQLHVDYENMMRGGHIDTLIDLVGDRTASFMETLGDMLNGMDAVSPDDEWMAPIFDEAHRLWPQPPAVESIV